MAADQWHILVYSSSLEGTIGLLVRRFDLRTQSNLPTPLQRDAEESCGVPEGTGVGEDLTLSYSLEG